MELYNLWGWAMLQKVSVDCFRWVEDLPEFDEDFIKRYNEKTNEGCFLEFHIQHPKELHELHNDLPFLPERIKIEKVKDIVANLHDKNLLFILKN